MELELDIIPASLKEQYLSEFGEFIKEDFDKLVDSELSTENFSFYTSVSAVSSSKIEGEHVELDSYIKHKRFGIEYQTDYTRKIDDLYEAYLFAQNNLLDEKSLLKAHALITKHILKKHQRGKIRTSNMFVITNNGKIEYVAASPNIVKSEMVRFFKDLDTLLNACFSFEEDLFYASLLHLVFVKIHPFDDGNGRTARLLEKWYIAQKWGSNAWFVQSEKNYYDKHNTYYNNIRLLGLEYDGLNYNKAMPFLKMLPESIINR
ncbi:MAG: Fic family protein [Bacteroidales bacterium]